MNNAWFKSSAWGIAEKFTAKFPGEAAPSRAAARILPVEILRYE